MLILHFDLLRRLVALPSVLPSSECCSSLHPLQSLIRLVECGRQPPLAQE
ncbi:hypothetical protein KC19_VG149700 [Ceratodon purpureus]|uniref:Uncharacterized protein n=1 Tax=Ceratodon purpureus TaxID=3225 RepID=A0A8T0HQQ0_CERPU|nr:hypothetical protein KC19_VG149700 [Ceratodon purpureus]